MEKTFLKKSRKWSLIPIPPNNFIKSIYFIFKLKYKTTKFHSKSSLVLILHLTRILIRIMQCDIPITLYLAINFILIRTSTFFLLLYMPFSFHLHSFLNLDDDVALNALKVWEFLLFFLQSLYSLNYHASTLNLEWIGIKKIIY